MNRFVFGHSVKRTDAGFIVYKPVATVYGVGEVLRHAVEVFAAEKTFEREYRLFFQVDIIRKLFPREKRAVYEHENECQYDKGKAYSRYGFFHLQRYLLKSSWHKGTEHWSREPLQ